MTDIDLSFRPATYWPDEDTLELRIGRVKGEQRRLRAEELLREGKLDALSELLDEWLLAEDLSEEDREAWGRTDPSNLGGEFLPELETDEVEIARVAIASTTGDVQSIRARRTERGIAVRVMDEYDNPFLPGEQVYDRPLTLGGLIAFIDSSVVDGADDQPGGLVLGTVRTWFEYDPDDPESLLDAAWASSAFYPQLGVYYEHAVRRTVDELKASRRARDAEGG